MKLSSIRLPDTIFARLFGLVLLAMCLSHLMMFVLFTHFMKQHPPEHDFRPPPPPPPPIHQSHSPPPPLPPYPSHFPGPPHHHDDFWIGILIQFTAVSLAAWVGARIMARPFQIIAQAATHFSCNLNAPPLKEQGPIESREAARLFNQMQKHIRQHIEERAHFLAAISHDLRTPLTRLKLRIERCTDDDFKASLKNDLDEMAILLNTTLDYLRDPSHTESWQDLDIQSLIESIAEDIEGRSPNTITVQGKAAPLKAQPVALRRCLTNLIDNAVRYGQSVKIFLIDTPNAITIHIHDNGPGIPENQMEAVLAPFVRLESSRNKNTGGIGLGLSIAHDIIKNHHGKLSFYNHESDGFTVQVLLPRQRN